MQDVFFVQVECSSNEGRPKQKGQCGNSTVLVHVDSHFLSHNRHDWRVELESGDGLLGRMIYPVVVMQGHEMASPPHGGEAHATAVVQYTSCSPRAMNATAQRSDDTTVSLTAQ